MWTALPDAASPAPAAEASPRAPGAEASPRPPAVDARPRAAAVIAFADVYRDHAAFVWRVLRRLGVRPDEVEDAGQEVFLVVHRKLAGFEGRSSLRTWLYGIAVRCAAQRRRRRRGPPPAEAAPEPVQGAVQVDVLAQREARAELDEILDELDDPKRAVFVLYELEEMTMAEVAATVGCPLQTAYSRLQAARSAFEAAIRRRRARERAP